MSAPHEVKLSTEFLNRIEKDIQDNVAELNCASAFESYNRGGGPGGSYDRHYDRSTGKADSAVASKVIAD